MTRILGLLATALIVTVTASSPLIAAQSPDPARPAAGRDTVVIGLLLEPDTFNPLFAERAPSNVVLSTIFAADTVRDSAWKVLPQGVEYLPSLKDGTWKVDGERMALVWRIKPRNWQDGRPVTCGDYVLALRILRDKRVRAWHQSEANGIANISCPKGAGGTEVTVNWSQRSVHANLVLGYRALPRHLLEPFYRTNPSRLYEAPYGNDPKATIGDGAYRLVEWQRGVSLTVESVGDHPIFGTPKIKRITWRVFPDTNALVASMLSGAIDAISATASVGISVEQAVQLERQSAGRVKVSFNPGLIWEHLDFNLDNPLLQDVRVRRAIAHGINRAQISRRLFQGKQPVAHSYLPPRHPGYTDTVPKYPYDPARARALLQRAGFAIGPDGIMRNAAGQRLSLEINSTAGNQTREQVEQILQEQLRQVGIEIMIVNFHPRVLFGELINRRKFKALTLYAWVTQPTDDCDRLYTSDGIPTEANVWTGSNYPGYKNADMDRICKAVKREFDEAERNRLLKESAVIFSRDLPAMPLYFRLSIIATKVRLKNFNVNVNFEGWNVHQWYWE